MGLGWGVFFGGAHVHTMGGQRGGSLDGGGCAGGGGRLQNGKRV